VNDFTDRQQHSSVVLRLQLHTSAVSDASQSVALSYSTISTGSSSTAAAAAAAAAVLARLPSTVHLISC
jgi:hypothetical protein